MSAVRIGRAFSPENCPGNPTQGVALGWYGTGPLALRIRRGFAPKAHRHTSLGHRPRYAATNNPRAKGPSHTSEGQRPSTGASPQEWIAPTQRRAESPIQGNAGNDVGHHFCGVTKLIAHGIGRAFSPREIVSTGFLGRCPRLVWRWAIGPGTQVTPRSRFHASIVTLGPETQTAPKARFHNSLGQRPRYATPTRIEG
jgi:hypothetical protein